MNDAVTGLEEGAPEPGDVSLCAYCGHLMAFADDLSLRPLTDEEMHAIAGSPVLIEAQRISAVFRAVREKRLI